MTTLFWCIIIITAVHVCQVSGISIGTCNLDSEINLLSTKEKQKLSILHACLVSCLQILSTITMTYTISNDPSQL